MFYFGQFMAFEYISFLLGYDFFDATGKVRLLDQTSLSQKFFM